MTLTLDRDKVRLLISDVGGQGGNTFLFSDTEIETFLSIKPTVLRAAALALRTIAGNEAMTAKRIKFLDLETDGPAVAKELRALAVEYEQVEEDDSDFAIANYGGNEFSRRELRGL